MIQWSVFRSRRSVIRWILVQSGFDRSLIWKWICSKGTPQIRKRDPDSPKGTHPKYFGLKWVLKKLKTSYCKTRIYAMNIKVTFPLIPTHNFRKKFLSHKLRCYTEISGPEKSRNNTSEKLRCFFTCVDIANQLLTRLSPLAPLGQFDEWSAKCSRFSI